MNNPSIKSEQPLVTAVVSCYNHARFVLECLESIQAQTYGNLEVVVVDDCSKDNSPQLIADWIHDRKLDWKFIRHTRNVGVCRSLNEAIRAATGEFISIIATDDVWLPDKIEKQIELIKQLPREVGVIYSDAFQIDEKGQRIPKMFIESHRDFSSMPQGNIELVLWEDNFIPVPTTLIRKRCYDVVGLYDEDLFLEDWDLWLRIAQKFEFAYSSSVSAKYRLVGTSMVRSSMDRMVDSSCRMCEKHLRLGGLSPAARRGAVMQLARQAVISYRLHSPKHKLNLLRAACTERSLGLIAALFFAWSGLNYDAYEGTRQALKTKLSRFRRIFSGCQ